MLNPAQAAENWLKIKKHYEETRDSSPADTIKAIIEDLGLQTTTETFAVIAKLKKHDGRIYGKNREFMDSIEVDPACLVWNHSNPMLSTGLDDIHTAHIDQMIGELRK